MYSCITVCSLSYVMTIQVSDVAKYDELIETMRVLGFDEEELGHTHAVLVRRCWPVINELS